MKKITYTTLFFLISQLLLSSSYAQNKAADKEKQDYVIKIKGKTKDKKYPIYDLKGGVSHFKFFSGKHSFQEKDLETRLKYIDLKDVNNGKYTCTIVCQDKHGNIVGLNPERKDNSIIEKKD